MVWRRKHEPLGLNATSECYTVKCDRCGRTYAFPARRETVILLARRDGWAIRTKERVGDWNHLCPRCEQTYQEPGMLF